MSSVTTSGRLTILFKILMLSFLEKNEKLTLYVKSCRFLKGKISVTIIMQYINFRLNLLQGKIYYKKWGLLCEELCGRMSTNSHYPILAVDLLFEND